MKNKQHATIEENITLLQQQSSTQPTFTIGQILEILSAKGPLLTILLFTLPFCQPIQIPGLSTPFGIAIAFLGLKLILKKAWLPQKILNKEISSNTLNKIAEKVLWLVHKTKRWTYPRLVWFCHAPMMQIINGLLIFALGLCLALPLPIPFSNLTAAWSLFFISLGLLEDDGVLVLIGYIASLFTFAFLTTMIILNIKIIEKIFTWKTY